jgi:hypothetical protein
VCRYALLPFSLANVAGFRHGRGRGRHERGAWDFRLLVSLIGATITFSYITWLFQLIAVASHCIGGSADEPIKRANDLTLKCCLIWMVDRA